MQDSPHVVRIIKYSSFGVPKERLEVKGKKTLFYGYQIYPYYKNSTLINLLIKAQNKNHTFSTDLIRYLIKQVVKNVHYLHGINIAHLDLKPDNIIIRDDFSTSLIDFGHSHPTGEKINKTYIGTIKYLPPEIVELKASMTEKKNFSPEKADIFTLGLTLYMLMF